MAHTHTNLLVHVVFSTQRHLPLITAEIKAEHGVDGFEGLHGEFYRIFDWVCDHDCETSVPVASGSSDSEFRAIQIIRE